MLINTIMAQETTLCGTIFETESLVNSERITLFLVPISLYSSEYYTYYLTAGGTSFEEMSRSLEIIYDLKDGENYCLIGDFQQIPYDMDTFWVYDLISQLAHPMITS